MLQVAEQLLNARVEFCIVIVVIGVIGPVYLCEASSALVVRRVTKLANNRLKRTADEDEYLLVSRQAAVGEDLTKGVPNRTDDVLPGVDERTVKVEEDGAIA
jgi:hypothetical protein